MHPVIDAPRVEQRIDRMHRLIVAAICEGVEDAQLDVVVMIERRQRLARLRPPVQVEVVDEDAYAHTPPGGIEDGVEQHPAGVVLDEDVVLDIERALGGANHLRAQHEPVHAAREKAHAGQPRIHLRLRRRLLAERRGQRCGQGVDGVRG